MTDTAALDRARQALDDHAWQDAYEAFALVAADQGLSGEDLERLAEAALWTAHPQDVVDALERAYGVYSRDGNHRRAGYVALDVAEEYFDKLQPAVGQGWFQRAVRLLESEPEGVEHGYLQLAYARTSLGRGALDEATQHAIAVFDLGARFADRDLQAFGLVVQGMVLVLQAKIDEGLSLIDEATVAAVGGELTPRTTGIIYCITIDVCRDLADYRRAGEWTEAASRWCERQAIAGFPGICRVHRAEIMRLRGALAEAEVEARRSTEELMAFGKLPMAGAGFHEIGEVRLRIGDLDAAEEAFEQAHQLGSDPQPGMALLQLARGRMDAARSSINAALDDQSVALSRARLLPARVEIALAAHDIADAREAAEELRAIAADYDAPALHAGAHQALGVTLTYEGDAAASIAELRTAVRHWSEADMPFETAQARRCLALAYRSGGNETSAVLELRAAGATFRRLGARLDAERCDEMIRAGEQPDAGRRVARAFMFTDIVGSTNLLETIGDEAWESVARWHNETLQAVIEANHGEVVHTTGDGFFAAFDDATLALSCAIAIQRRLADHRREHGFAPQVRIGVHSAEATVMADDYAGVGVHAAARVAARAEGGEILITCETVEREPLPFTLTNERTVSLKGLAQPVRVVSVDWRTPPSAAHDAQSGARAV
jgi:class 3 adenylate cyclase